MNYAYRRDTSISDYYRALIKLLETSIQQKADNYIIETPTVDIIAKLLEETKALIPIELDLTKKESMTYRKEMRRVPASSRQFSYANEGDVDFEYEIIDVTVPIITNPTMSIIRDLETSTHSMSWSKNDFQWNAENVRFSFEVKGYGFKHDEDKVVKEIEQRKQHIRERIGWINNDISHGLKTTETELLPFIENRKRRLAEDKNRIGSLSEKLGIKLEQ